MHLDCRGLKKEGQVARSGMSPSSVARHLARDSRAIFRIVKRYVVDALSRQVLEAVKDLSIDKTSSKKGHNYLTIVADRIRKKVVGVSVGKSSVSMEQALEEMEFRGAAREDVKRVTMDM